MAWILRALWLTCQRAPELRPNCMTRPIRAPEPTLLPMYCYRHLRLQRRRKTRFSAFLAAPPPRSPRVLAIAPLLPQPQRRRGRERCLHSPTATNPASRPARRVGCDPVYSLRAIEMGNLSTEELFISPLASLVIFVVVMIFLEYGSRFFNRMQEVPSLEWKVLELFRGDLLDVLTRREALPRGLGLGGVRSLHMLAAEEDPSMQSRAASAIASLLHLAATVTEAQPDEQLRALAALTGKYTLGSRAHAAIGVAAAALNEARCPLLEQSGALRGVVELSHVPDPEVQGAAALAVALLAQSEPTRASMLHQGGLLAIQALLRSAHPDAMRCAACALAAVATEPDAPRHVARVFAPRLLVMLLRSRDPFLQAVGSMAIGALADADPSVRLRLLQSNALRPLAAIVRNSRSSVARFEACHALGCLAARADEVMHADSQERAIRAFSHAIASFSSGTLRPYRLQELHAALHTKPREELMAYYRHRPELARYTVAHELSRMEYHATTFNGTELEGAEAVGAFHASLDEKGQRGMLWRLANQSVLSDVIEAMHLHGYVDMELGASLRATSVRRLRSQRAPTARHRTLPHAAASECLPRRQAPRVPRPPIAI